MSIRAVIFDVGGVLLRTEDQSPRRKWEERFGLEPRGLSQLVFESDASYRASIGAASVDNVWAHVGKQLRLSNEELLQLRHDFWAGDRLDRELVEYIRSLRGKYKTGILSNAWPDARRILTDVHHLPSAVDAVIISAEEGVAKPDPAIYQIAADRVGVAPAQALFVDDIDQNVQGARAAGMQAVHFNFDTFGTTAAFIRHLQEYLRSNG